MKQLIVFFAFFQIILFGNNLIAQDSKYFTLTDTNLVVGQKYILRNYSTTWKGGFLPESEVTFDSIVQFLKNNPTIKIELSCHRDQRGSEKMNLELSEKLASIFKIELYRRGDISRERIIAIGLGEKYPIIPLDSIMKFPKEERDFLYQKNLRYELKIINTSYVCKEFCINNIYGCDTSIVKLDKKYNNEGDYVGYDSSYSLLKENLYGLTVLHSPLDSNIITNVIYYIDDFYFNQNFILYKNDFRSKSDLKGVFTMEQISFGLPLKIIDLNEEVRINILYNQDYTLKEVSVSEKNEPVLNWYPLLNEKFRIPLNK